MSNHRRTFLRRTALLGSGLAGAATGTATADSGAADLDATASARIEGTVRHFGAPVADATVRIDSETSTVTDETGTYSVVVESGEYVLEVTAPGYASRSSSVRTRDGETVTRDVRLERKWGPGTGELEVSATPAGGGKTIPCEIDVFGDERYGVTASRGSVPDNETWGKGFEVSEGWWEILVTSAEGYSDGYGQVLVEDGETAFGWVQLAEGDDGIPETGTIAGSVVDETGTAIDDATVRTNGVQTSTGGDGAFERELEHGHHRIAVSAAGYERVAGGVQVKFGRTTELTVALRSEDT
ncbi:carboxypeptidase-like regulatory domain-containing protein [Natrinema salsiterrestre]|uniref:Carboxypeptidase-like regulatory domain-containing protein n=1 Tax=Natrinema salsiterrestre TaxID=2950540 RepID=A0A9Q4L2C2_9EURY|nr:carboxypeptidase-like regulatory domain-containing protein [Natrinema salsiterrestre]MDF9746089.1 carboxypeptidase-like regulatory domain-containing protein [Natrinema salsiterrestre]